MDGEKTVAEQIEEAVDGLKRKNKDLNKELRSAKDLIVKFDGVDIKALQKASKELDILKTKSEEKKGEYKKLYDAQAVQHSTDMEKAAAELLSTQKTLAKERRTNDLTQALVEHHVEPELVSSAVTVLDAVGDIAVNDDGVSMVGDKTVSEHVKLWTEGEIGKHFITDANIGGGADGQGGKDTPEAAFFDPNSSQFNVTEQAKVANSDPARYQTLKKAAPAKKVA